MNVSRRSTRFIVAVAAVSLFVAGVASSAAARESRAEVSLMGGVQALNQNDTGLSDQFITIPAVAPLTYRATSRLADT